MDEDGILDQELETPAQETASEPQQEVTNELTKESGIDDDDRALLAQVRQERELEAIDKDFKKAYGEGFNLDKVIDKIQEMEKESPGSGASMFNRVGIENIYLKHFNNAQSGGVFESGSGRGTVAPSRDELIDKINRGVASEDEQLSLYEKFL